MEKVTSRYEYIYIYSKKPVTVTKNEGKGNVNRTKVCLVERSSMKIIKFDRSFSSRAITDEVFFFSSLDTKKQADPYCVSPRVTFHFCPTEVPFILLQESWCTSHRRDEPDVGVFVIEGSLCFVWKELCYKC